MSQMSLEPTANFGTYLRFLRRRARLTQTELGIAVGYSHGQISMLEHGQRAPDLTAVMALFVSALGVQGDRPAAATLIELARTAVAASKQQVLETEGDAAPLVGVQQAWQWQQTEMGMLESVPPLPSCFVARPQMVQQVAQLLQRERRAALCGLPGMGKSTLAAAYAHDHARNYPVCWLTCGTAQTETPWSLLRQLALFVLAHGGHNLAAPAVVRRIAAGETPGPLRQQIFVLAGEVSQLRSPLFVFDDIHAVAHDAQLRELLQKLFQLAPRSRHLHITRTWLDFPDLPHLTVGGLAWGEAEALCRALATTPAEIEAAGESDAGLASIYASTAGSPLLLRLAVSRLEQGGQDLHASVGAAVAEPMVLALVAPLSPAARLLLDLLAIWRGAADLNEPALAALLAEQLPGSDHDHAVTELRRARLIDYAAHATLHPLLSAPILDTLRRQGAHLQALHRLAAQWAAHLDNPVDAAHHYGRAGDLALAVALLAEDAAAVGQGPARETVVAELVNLARRQPPELATDRALRQLLLLQGDLWMNTLQVAGARASYREALELSVTAAARAEVAERLAACLLQIGLAQEALDLCVDAIATLSAADGDSTTHLLMQLESTRVRVLLGMGRLDEAEATCQEGLVVARRLRLVQPNAAEQVAASALRGLGYIARRRGHFAVAHRHFERALLHARDAGQPNQEAEILAYLSATLRDLGDFAGAQHSAQQALAVAQQAGNDYLAANILHYKSITSYYHYDLDDALEASHVAMALQRQLGDGEGMVSCAILQAVVYAALADLDAAQAAIDRARRDSLLFDNQWLQGMALYVFGIVHTLLADLAPAAAALEEALTLEAFVHDVPSRENALIFLGINQVAQGNLAAAAAIEARLAVEIPVEVELLGGLFRGMARLAAGDGAAARAVAGAVIARARAAGYLIYAAEARRIELAVDAPPPLAQLPHWVCCHGRR